MLTLTGSLGQYGFVRRAILPGAKLCRPGVRPTVRENQAPAELVRFLIGLLSAIVRGAIERMCSRPINSQDASSSVAEKTS